ncbi:hypothetical protein ACFL6C_08275 [Myxococcota bacterium]
MTRINLNEVEISRGSSEEGRLVANHPAKGRVGYVTFNHDPEGTVDIDLMKVNGNVRGQGLEAKLLGTIIDTHHPTHLSMSLTDTSRDEFVDALPHHWAQMTETDFQRVAQQAVRETTAYKTAYAHGYRMDSFTVRRNPDAAGDWDRFVRLKLEMRPRSSEDNGPTVPNDGNDDHPGDSGVVAPRDPAVHHPDTGGSGLVGTIAEILGASDRDPMSAPQPIDEAVAIIEHQWTVEEEPRLAVHPLQTELNSESRFALKSAFYPNWGGILDDARDPDAAYQEGYKVHDERVYATQKAGRSTQVNPFLLNLSRNLPEAIEQLIEAGVKVFSISIAVCRGARWRELDTVIRAHPDVLFFVANAHIDGNNTTLKELKDYPQYMALEGVPNVILVGTMDYYRSHVATHRDGMSLGSTDNPFDIHTQPANDACQYFMVGTRAPKQAFNGEGASSGATPLLASLTGLVIKSMKARGIPLQRDRILEELEKLFHRAHAREKDGRVHEVSYFTIDTLRLNAGEDPLPDATWWDDVLEHPQPLPLPALSDDP